MESAQKLEIKSRFGVWLAPILALLWLSLLLGSIALLLYCWSLVKTAWSL